MIELVAIDIEVESGHNELIFSNIKNVDKNAWKVLSKSLSNFLH